MGGGRSYSFSTRAASADDLGFCSKSKEEIFRQKRVHEKMNPFGVKIRECRDSEAHPESLAIIIGLDETGSMDYIPADLIKDGFPSIMKSIYDSGIKHPQVMFVGVGDHKSDNGPLQVGQFEVSDDLLDFWLTHVWLEGNGAGYHDIRGFLHQMDSFFHELSFV